MQQQMAHLLSVHKKQHAFALLEVSSCTFLLTKSHFAVLAKPQELQAWQQHTADNGATMMARERERVLLCAKQFYDVSLMVSS